MADNRAERKDRIVRYMTSVKPMDEVSLRDSGTRRDEPSRAAAEQKAALVFDLLQRTVGAEVYERLAPRLSTHATPTGWNEIKTAFEKESHTDLALFFKQWVDRKGLPDIRIENESVRRNGSRFEVMFDLVQHGEAYDLDLPVSIRFLNGTSRTEMVKADAGKKQVSLLVDEEPEAISIDPGYEVPRRLTAREVPPLLAKLLAGEKLILVTAATRTEVYSGAVRAWKERGAEERQAAAVRDADLKEASVIVFGTDSPLISRLYGTVEAGKHALHLVAKKNPWNEDRVVVIVEAGTEEDASGMVNAVVKHGVCSELSVDARGGTATQRTLSADQGIVLELREEPPVVNASAFTSLSRVIDGVSGRRIVYVGEYHDRFSHHNVQLRIIRELHRRDPNIAVGMEMFQRPFQKTLDDYINGLIDEREFLRRAEYFKRWNFDYNLYKPILDFARAEKVPVIALNINRDITDKVSKTGLDSLTEEERKNIPVQTDFSDDEYRGRLKHVFEQHRSTADRSFDHFYQAQILWDEIMAQSIDEYLRKNPDRRMVVMAGLWHIAYGSGIPKRAHRRSGHSYATILSDVEVDPGIADFIVFPQALDGVTAPKIMVSLKESGRTLSVTDMPENSVSKKAGIKVGDRLLSIDGAPIESMDDLRIALFYKKKDEPVRIRVVRKRFLLGDTEMEFAVITQ